MSSITIPLVEESHAEVLMNLALEAFTCNFEVYGHYPPGLDSLEWHAEQIKGGHCHAIMYGDELVGGIYLEPHPDQEMKLDFFFIGKDHQGKKIGSTVMGLIEEKYAEVKKWFLYTPYKDYGNHYLYEKHGYTKVAEFRPDESSEFTLWHYEKPLGTIEG